MLHFLKMKLKRGQKEEIRKDAQLIGDSHE